MMTFEMVPDNRTETGDGTHNQNGVKSDVENRIWK